VRYWHGPAEFVFLSFAEQVERGLARISSEVPAMTERRFPVSGDIDLATAPELQEKLLVLVNLTTDDLILDCADLDFIDSIGVSVFVYTQRLLEVQDREFRVINMSDKACRVFEVLGLTDILGFSELDPA
jgi:anti-anti-sigma factor